MCRTVLLVCAVAICLATRAAESAWILRAQDDFGRTSLGADWLALRGDWHINADHQLQIQRQWPSDCFLMHTLPLRGVNTKVELDVQVPSRLLGFRTGAKGAPLDQSAVTISLQAGALGWGGGGIDDRVTVKLLGTATPPPADNAAADQRTVIPLDRWVHVALTLADGQFTADVDGKRVAAGPVPQGRSLVNCTLQLFALPCALFDNVKLLTQPMAQPPAAVSVATAAENRKATILLTAKDLDMGKPDCGIQAALDSLPPAGGVVVLPKGTFTLRTFLELRGHGVLAGQGPETILQAPDMTAVAVESVATEKGVTRVTLKPPHDFRAGEAFAYGSAAGGSPNWGHPMNSKNPSANRLRVLAVDGNVLTVTAPPLADVKAPYRVAHFFPPVCSYESEFAEVKDLAIRGSAVNPAGCSGGFMVNPITFGVTSHPRFTRLLIEQFPADGISAQTCDDARFLDCTFRGVAQGMHPGTSTLRTLVARNYSVANTVGLYFCWYNQQGMYIRNTLKNFTGYPDAGDVFNTLAFNRLTEPMTITVGFNGCLFGNSLPALQLSVPGENNDPGGRTYGLPARYFTIGANRIDKLTLMKGAWGNVLAANTLADGKPTPLEFMQDAKTQATGEPEKLVLDNGAKVAPIAGLPEAITRTDPVPPPALPAPLLDGREFYKPDTPDCGFQAALDKLAPTGGTLRLPAGRYALAEALRVPARVTLIGYGSATVLLPAGEAQGLVTVSGVAGVDLREFTIEGTWTDAVADATAAVMADRCDNLSLVALDVRGWAGDAVRVSDGRGVSITDCRVFRCAGTGYGILDSLAVLCETNSAVLCGAGFVLRGGQGVRLFGNIAGLNRKTGYLVASPGALLAGNNAHNNRLDGVLVDGVAGVIVAGNTCSANNQAGAAAAGIRIDGGAAGTRVLFNNCGDEQPLATQLLGILEEPSGTRSEIRFNVTATLTARRGHEKDPSLVAKGSKSTVAGNWTDTILPANDSLEVIDWLKAQP